MSGTRRRFLQLLAVAAAAGAAVFAGLRLRLSWRDRALADEIRGALPDLEISDAVLNAFLRDHRHYADRPGYAAIGHSAGLHGRFVLSTNFYENGGYSGRELAYVTYYDPWLSACYNPLIRRGES